MISKWGSAKSISKLGIVKWLQSIFRQTHRKHLLEQLWQLCRNEGPHCSPRTWREVKSMWKSKMDRVMVDQGNKWEPRTWREVKLMWKNKMDILMVDQGNKFFFHIKVSGGPLNTIAACFKAKHPAGLKVNILNFPSKSMQVLKSTSIVCRKGAKCDCHPNTAGTLQLVKVFAEQWLRQW